MWANWRFDYEQMRLKLWFDIIWINSEIGTTTLWWGRCFITKNANQKFIKKRLSTIQNVDIMQFKVLPKNVNNSKDFYFHSKSISFRTLCIMTHCSCTYFIANFCALWTILTYLYFLQNFQKDLGKFQKFRKVLKNISEKEYEFPGLKVWKCTHHTTTIVKVQATATV